MQQMAQVWQVARTHLLWWPAAGGTGVVGSQDSPTVGGTGVVSGQDSPIYDGLQQVHGSGKGAVSGQEDVHVRGVQLPSDGGQCLHQPRQGACLDHPQLLRLPHQVGELARRLILQLADQGTECVKRSWGSQHTEQVFKAKMAELQWSKDPC